MEAAPLELNRNNFSSAVLVEGLDSPWHLVWGADNQLSSPPLVGEDAPNFGKSAGEGAAVQRETGLEHV
ncbi:hypothetical protein AGMMS50256_21840 [Betaproteobacteria bacterium]|nr:hypothetical protein AGMMS50256_21840 [Betaproteobacteria bacterium]